MSEAISDSAPRPAERVEPADPRQEAAELADALRAHLQRLGRRGARRVAAPGRAVPRGPAPAAAPRPAAAPAPAAGPRPAPAPAPAAGLRPAAPPADADEPRFAAAPPLDRPPDRPAPRPAPRPPAPASGRGAPETAARELRARAAACPDLAALAAAVADCTACPLARTRTRTVFADGRARVPLMFVGEAPGADEDAQGVPFVGRAGQLLTDIITKGMGLAREDVYIANVLKCRPPGNRDPSSEEKALCTGWLDRQIELVDPRVIVPLGRHAACHVLRTDATMGSLRGRVHELGGRKVVPTYHPAYLLRTPSDKRKCWDDIQLAMRLLGLPTPGRAES